MPTKEEILAEFNREFLKISGFKDEEISKVDLGKLTPGKVRDMIGEHMHRQMTRDYITQGKPVPYTAEWSSLKGPKKAESKEEFNKEFLLLSGFSQEEVNKVKRIGAMSANDILRMVKSKK